MLFRSPTLQAMNAGTIPGHQNGFVPPTGGFRSEYLGTAGKYSAPSALSGAGRYILSQAGELESGISIIRKGDPKLPPFFICCSM